MRKVKFSSNEKSVSVKFWKNKYCFSIVKFPIFCLLKFKE